jgi:hypothetical protein
MLAAFAEQSGLEVQVFDDPARAERWLAEGRDTSTSS